MSSTHRYWILVFLFLLAGCGQKAMITDQSLPVLKEDKAEYGAIRKSDIAKLADATLAYRKDHDNALPTNIPYEALLEICKTKDDCEGLLQLNFLIPKYLAKVPVDPVVPDQYKGTGYGLIRNKDDAVSVISFVELKKYYEQPHK